jgi:hypothetical protein
MNDIWSNANMAYANFSKREPYTKHFIDTNKGLEFREANLASGKSTLHILYL